MEQRKSWRHLSLCRLTRSKYPGRKKAPSLVAVAGGSSTRGSLWKDMAGLDAMTRSTVAAKASCRWTVDERDSDGITVIHELVGELHHGDELADGEAGVEHHGLLHRGFECFLAGRRGSNYGSSGRWRHIESPTIKT
uniref:Uncharacterized protein n=1 Tax=Oryza brachyantha TaxID=4533 RepID=J3M933_ORYBR